MQQQDLLCVFCLSVGVFSVQRFGVCVPFLFLRESARRTTVFFFLSGDEVPSACAWRHPAQLLPSTSTPHFPLKSSSSSRHHPACSFHHHTNAQRPPFKKLWWRKECWAEQQAWQALGECVNVCRERERGVCAPVCSHQRQTKDKPQQQDVGVLRADEAAHKAPVRLLCFYLKGQKRKILVLVTKQTKARTQLLSYLPV